MTSTTNKTAEVLAALERGDVFIDVMHTHKCGSRHNGDCFCKAKDNRKHVETILRALRIAAAVDGDELVKTFSPSSMVSNVEKIETMNYVAGNNSLLDRLREME